VDITLHSSGLDDLSPRQYRSPGVHGSTLIDRLCLRYGHYQKNKDGSPLSDRNRELGQAFEQVKCEQIIRAYPNEAFARNPEILCDGIYLTPDLVWTTQLSLFEFKWTWMSPARDPNDEKMWKYLAQGQSYLYGLRRVMEGTAVIRAACETEEEADWHTAGDDKITFEDAYTVLYLTVGFANDFRPQSEQIPCWRIRFWPEELAMNWAMMLDEKRLLEEETANMETTR